MKIGSFDVGLKNMAFVCIDENLFVHHVVLQDLKKKNVETTIKFLNNLPICDVIIIEKQLPRNTTAVVLQNQIDMYYQVKGVKTHLFNPKLKTPTELTYRQRKQYTVELAKKASFPFIKDCKQDDLADAYCQAVKWLEISKI